MKQSDPAALAARIADLEVIVKTQELMLISVAAALDDLPRLIACMRSTAAQQDAHGLYATSLSDEQLQRALARFEAAADALQQRTQRP